MKLIKVNDKYLQYDNKFISVGPISSLYYEYPGSITASVPDVPTTLNVNTDVTAYNYCTLKFDQVYSGVPFFATDIEIDYWDWRIRTHCYSLTTASESGAKGIRDDGNFVSENEYVQYSIRDGRIMYYYTLIPDSVPCEYKLVLDRDASNISAFIDNTYLGYGTITSAVTSLDNIKIINEQNGSLTSASNFKLAGFDNLTDACNF